MEIYEMQNSWSMNVNERKSDIFKDPAFVQVQAAQKYPYHKNEEGNLVSFQLLNAGRIGFSLRVSVDHGNHGLNLQPSTKLVFWSQV